HCVGLTSFYKNQQETPKPDKDRAIKRRKRWIELFGEKPPKN
ncbi:MAG: type II toxin-antitoxin system RelE/ParE family toxin, partial [Frankiaceae bacterium]|nr:type II toxin-antitoxin system RelE/ParE family toxin [Frankiaceae bacterium]